MTSCDTDRMDRKYTMYFIKKGTIEDFFFNIQKTRGGEVVICLRPILKSGLELRFKVEKSIIPKHSPKIIIVSHV